MWPFTRSKSKQPKPDWWISGYYVAWCCNSCRHATAYDATEKPRCCRACGCEVFYEQVGRERKDLRNWYANGRFFPRGLDIELPEHY